MIGCSSEECSQGTKATVCGVADTCRLKVSQYNNDQGSSRYLFERALVRMNNPTFKVVERRFVASTQRGYVRGGTSESYDMTNVMWRLSWEVVAISLVAARVGATSRLTSRGLQTALNLHLQAVPNELGSISRCV